MYKIGDIVNLKSGGAYMTIVEVEGDMATCVWTDDDARPHEFVLPFDAIEPQKVVDIP